jgi:hypothetical protein
MSSGKKPTNETPTSASTRMIYSNSFQDIFTSENSEQAKDLLMNNVRHEMNRSHSRAISESGSDDNIIHKLDHVDMTIKPTITKIDKNKRKPTMLLTGPKFRSHIIQSKYDLKRDTIYPVSVCNKNKSNLFIYLLLTSVLLVLFP